jgi:hypothetical protein
MDKAEKPDTLAPPHAPTTFYHHTTIRNRKALHTFNAPPPGGKPEALGALLSVSRRAVISIDVPQLPFASGE